MKVKILIPVINMKKTGENIRYLRKKAGVSVKRLQSILGFGSHVPIYKWEEGTALPAIDNLVILASVLNVTVDDILITENVEAYYEVSQVQKRNKDHQSYPIKSKDKAV